MSRLESNGNRNTWINSDINQGKYIHSGVIRQRSGITDSIIDMTKPVMYIDNKDCEEKSTDKKEKRKHKQEKKVKKSHKKEKKFKKSKERRREDKAEGNSVSKIFNPILQLLSVRIL